MHELSARLDKVKAPEDLRADAEIYLKAAHWITQHPEEFLQPEYNDQLWQLLDRGLARASELAAGHLHGPVRRAVCPAPIDPVWTAVFTLRPDDPREATIPLSRPGSTLFFMDEQRK